MRFQKGQIVAKGVRRGSGLVLHTIRTKDYGTKALKYGRKLAIRLFCVECLGFEGDPKECTSPLCPLYPFRGTTLASQKGQVE